MILKNLYIKSIEFFYNIKYNLCKKPEINYLKEFKKIALILTSPLGLGDLIMMIPVINSFRKNFPNAKIHLITDKNIFDKVSFVDEIKIVKGSLLSLRNEFKKLSFKKYDLGVVMSRAVNQSVYVDFLKPRYKLGYLGGYNLLSNFRLKKEDLSFDKNIHFTSNSLKILDSLNLKTHLELVSVNYDNKIKDETRMFYNNIGLDKSKKTIVLNPFVLWDTRRWDEKNYINLVRKLHKRFNFILYGGSDAIKLNQKIENKLKEENISISNITNKLHLKNSIYFLKYVDLLITSDAGPMHFAFMMKTPTIGFFGPVKPNQRLPLQNNNIFTGIWYGDYKKCTMYDYESTHIDKKMNGLKVILVKDVERKIVKFFKEKDF